MRRIRLLLLLIPIVALAGMGALMVPRGSGAPALDGGVVFRDQPVAPDFRLTDQVGKNVTLAQLRGRPVLISFLESHCTQQCPLIVDKIRAALSDVRSRGGNPAVLAISTDPEGDTRASIRQFSALHGMLGKWQFLNGARSKLVSVWHDYYVYAAPKNAPPALRDSHVSATYLLDQNGHERVLLAGNPDLRVLIRDLRILSGVPADISGHPLSAPEVGFVAPGFSLRDLQGRTRTLESTSARLVMLNFWATTCPPCRSEMPRLAGWYNKLKSRGFLILGVDKQEDPGTVNSFVRTLRIPYPILLDSVGDTASRYDLFALPATILIDRHGVVRSVHYGVLDASYLSSEVMPLLAKS